MENIKCTCGIGNLILRKGKFGEFYGCDTFPKCKKTVNVKLIDKYKVQAKGSTKKEFKYTPEQENILVWVDNAETSKDFNNLLVEACAGSGKTTIIEHAVRKVNKDAIYLVFNAKNRDEAISKGLPAKTTHQHGFSALRKYCETKKIKPKIYSNKVRDIVKNLIGDKKENDFMVGIVSRLVSLFKNNYQTPQKELIEPYMNQYGIDYMGDLNDVIISNIYEITAQAFNLSIENLEQIDFDDMLYLPLHFNLPIEKYNWVFADEVQDFNNCQLELLKRTVTKNLLAVGDRNQSCYGFRGAAYDAMDNIKEAFNAEEKPLSVTFRVPKEGVKNVNSSYPGIKFSSLDNAKKGYVGSVSDDKFFSSVQDGDLVLCRMNAPLISNVLELLAMGRKAVILGRDIGKTLTNLINYVTEDKVIDTDKFLDMLYIYQGNEEKRLRKLDREMAIELLNDKVEGIEAISQGCADTRCIIKKIEKLFSEDSGKGIIFSTIHRAKGLEAKNVYSIKSELMPHPAAKTDEQKLQERNLGYIRDTRFIENYYFVV